MKDSAQNFDVSEIKKLDIYPYIAPFYAQGRIHLRQAQAGDCVADAGGDDYHIVYILQGRMKVFSFAYNGRRLLLDEVESGSFSGHISKLRGYNFESTIVARTPCVYLEFPDQVFTQLMEHGDFALRFYQGTSQRTYHMYRKILSLNLFSLEENTAFYAITHQNHMEGMTLDDISEEIGISRRTLCYIIRRWKQAGILEKAPRGYHIRDLATLEDMARNIRQFYQSVGP